MELLLVANNNCFLCLQTIPEDPCGYSRSKEICLKNICRFLHINTSALLSKALVEGPQDAFTVLKNAEYNFTVKLCNQCYSLTEKFSSLIHDMEVVQLKVGHYSHMFQNVIADADERTPAAATRKVENSVDVRVIQHLRREARQKCGTHIDLSLPVVRLERLKEDTISAWKPADNPSESCTSDADQSDDDIPPSPGSSNNLGSPKHAPEASSTYEVTDDLTREREPVKRVLKIKRKDLPIKSKTKKTVNVPPAVPGCSDAPHNNKISSVAPSKSRSSPNPHMEQILDGILKTCYQFPNSNYFQCAFCSGQSSRFTIRTHLIDYHVDKLFSFVNQAPLSEKTFWEHCQHVLDDETNKCEMVLRPTVVGGAPGPQHYSVCYLCGESFFRQKHVKAHFVVYHADILTGRLDTLQPTEHGVSIDGIFSDYPVSKNSNTISPGKEGTDSFPDSSCVTLGTVDMVQVLKEVTAKYCRDNKSQGRSTCTLCGKSVLITERGRMRTHLTSVHSDVVLHFTKREDISEADFKTICYRLLRTEEKQCELKFSLNANRKLPKLKKSAKMSCYICKSISVDPQFLKDHMVMYHGEIISGKLYRLQDKACMSAQVNKAILGQKKRKHDCGREREEDRDPLMERIGLPVFPKEEPVDPLSIGNSSSEETED